MKLHSCSPIHFEPSVESTSTRHYVNSRIVHHIQKENQHDNMIMNKYVVIYILKVKQTEKSSFFII